MPRASPVPSSDDLCPNGEGEGDNFTGGALYMDPIMVECTWMQISYLSRRPELEQRTLDAFGDSAEAHAQYRELKAIEGMVPRWKMIIRGIGVAVGAIVVGYTAGSVLK